MPISPAASFERLGREQLSNDERQTRLARTTGVHVSGDRGRVERNYRAVGPVTTRIQNVDIDLSGLRRVTESLD